jgi:hypothetical protein
MMAQHQNRLARMARIPNGHQAFVDIVKLTGYVLNPNHRTGRHKARVFVAALGLTADHAAEFAEALQKAAATEDAVLEREDEYGAHYAIEFVILFKERSRRVRSLWTIRDEEDFPRFVSVFVMAEHEDHG